MSGAELYDKMVTINPTVRFLFTSGYASRGIHKKINIKEEMRILNKPFRLQDVHQAVNELLTG